MGGPGSGRKSKGNNSDVSSENKKKARNKLIAIYKAKVKGKSVVGK